MKSKKIIGMTVASALALAFAGSAVACTTPGPDPRTQNLTDAPLDGTKVVADYTKTADDRAGTFASGSAKSGVPSGWGNGDPFNAWWNEDNVSYDNNKLSLSISEITGEKPKVEQEGKDPLTVDYYGGEERSESYYGYGDYSVRMKPSAVAGTASTFFVCTGPYDVHQSTGEKNKHDEIDIEFLGKDTTKVQFNYFANGVGGHEFMYDLGFDASLEYHDYGFRWTSEYIVWFVDNTPVFKIKAEDRPSGESWPSTPGRLIMNYWTGTANAQNWMGAFSKDYSGHAEYEWVKCSAAPQLDPNKEQAPVTDKGLLLGDKVLNFTPGEYNIEYADDSKSMTVSYTDISTKGYAAFGTLIDSETFADNNVLTLKIKNNNDFVSKVRIDVVAPDKSVHNPNPDAEASTTTPYCNLSAEYTGDVATVAAGDYGPSASGSYGNDYGYGGADYVFVAPGGTVDVKIKFKNEAEPIGIKLFVDSSQWDFNSKRSGSVVFSDLKLSYEEDKKDDDDDGDYESISIALQDWAEGVYALTDEDGGQAVSYSYTADSGKKPKGYKCVGAAGLDFKGANKLTFKVKNAGAQQAALKIKLLQGGANGDGSDDIDAVESVTGTGASGEIGNNDGINLAIDSEGEATINVTFKSNVTPDKITVFFDSMSDNGPAAEAQSGKVIFKDYAVKNDGTAPIKPELPTPIGADYVSYTIPEQTAYTADGYTAERDADNNSVTISHAAAVGQYASVVYKNEACAKANVVKLTITNNDDTNKAVVKVSVKKDSGGVPCIVKTEKDEDGTLTAVGTSEWGEVLELDAGASVTLVITYDRTVLPDALAIALNSEKSASENTATGSITVSGIQFKYVEIA